MAVSVDKAFREMIRDEVESQLRPVREAMVKVRQQMEDLGALEDLAAQLAPLVSILTPGAPVKARKKGRAAAARGGVRRRAPAGENERPCAVIGCPRQARTKGYCSAHYQKLRNLTKTNRRPPEWVDFAPPHSVEDVVLPRGRAGAKALKEARGK
jgi:hypothetical protein